MTCQYCGRRACTSSDIPDAAAYRSRVDIFSADVDRLYRETMK